MAGGEHPKTAAVEKGSGERPALSTQARPAVVIVDDDPQVLRTLGRSLQGIFDVKEFESPQEAIEQVRRGGVSVVVSDIAMPKMTGLELLRAIRNHDPDIPVILITGEPTLEGATSAIELGVFRYLRKPCSPAEVRSTAEQASRLYRLAQTKREALELVGPAGASDRVGLEVTFRAALDTLWVAYQPIVSYTERTVYGYEALMRSAHGALPGPQHLLDAAERLHQLDTLGRLIRRRAVEPVATAPDHTLLFINLHPKDLMDSELADPDSPLAAIADRVVLEVTERSSLGGLDDVQARVAELRRLGYRIAIDDLGAGYAGLTSFALLEPEFVKIDMTLTRGIDRSAVKQKLVQSLTGLCREMNMTIVTEGVETAAERDTLVGLGCDLLQGYLFAKPGRPFPNVSW